MNTSEWEFVQRQQFMVAVRAWRRCGRNGTHSDYIAGICQGTCLALAQLLEISDKEAAERVLTYGLLRPLLTQLGF